MDTVILHENVQQSKVLDEKPNTFQNVATFTLEKILYGEAWSVHIVPTAGTARHGTARGGEW